MPVVPLGQFPHNTPFSSCVQFTRKLHPPLLIEQVRDGEGVGEGEEEGEGDGEGVAPKFKISLVKRYLENN